MKLWGNQLIINYSKNKTEYAEEHSHEDYCELYLLVDGKIVNHVNGVRQEINAPAIIYMRQSDTHYMERIKDTDCCFYLMMIRMSLYDKLKQYCSIPEGFYELEHQSLPPIYHVSTNHLLSIEYCINRLFRNHTEDNISKKIAEKELIFKCFSILFDDTPSSNGIDAPLWFKDIISNIEHRDILEKGVPALVEMSGKSNPYLCKCFKKYLQITPSKYINQLRIQKAATLLRTSDMDIIEIAFDVGFDNLGYFYTVFKNEFDIPPKQYRNKYLNTHF